MEPLNNPKHELFAQALIKHGGHQTKAYLEVYPKSKYASARHSASLLLTNAYIRQRLNELLEQNGLALLDCIRKLKNLTEAERFHHYKDGKAVMQPDNATRLQAVNMALKIHVLLGSSPVLTETESNAQEV